MKTFSLQTRLYSGQGSLAALRRFTNKHIWIICDGFLARSPLLETLRQALPADNRISVFIGGGATAAGRRPTAGRRCPG